MKYKNYQIIKIGDISKSKLVKFSKGQAVNLTYDELNGSKYNFCLHPENYKKVVASLKLKRGCRLSLTPGEINHDLQFHADNGMDGGSIFSFLKEKLWPILKPILSGVGDAVAYSNPTLVPLREGIRGLTGVGVSAKGSQAAKDKMAKLRAMRRSGGSFKMN